MANTFTSRLNLIKPEVGADDNAWGTHLNQDLNKQDNVYRDMGGDLTLTGSFVAYAVTTRCADYVDFLNGVHFRALINVSNVGHPTLGVDSMTNRFVRKVVDGVVVELDDHDMQAGAWGNFYADTVSNSWILDNPKTSIALDGLVATGALQFAPWSDPIPAAPTVQLANGESNFVRISGSANIVGFGLNDQSAVVFVQFTGDDGKLVYQANDMRLRGSKDRYWKAGDIIVMKGEGGTNHWTELAYFQRSGPLEALGLAASDETTPLTAGLAKARFRMPFDFQLTGVKGSLTAAQTSGTKLEIDIRINGVSGILAAPLTFDNNETTTATASVPAVLNASDVLLDDDDSVVIDISAIGNGTAKGLKIYLLGFIR